MGLCYLVVCNAGGIPRDLFRRPSSAPKVTSSSRASGAKNAGNAIQRQSSKDSNDSIPGGGSKETRFITGGTVVREEVGQIDVAFLSKRNRQLEKDGYSISTKNSNGNATKGKVAVNNGGSSGGSFGSALNENIRGEHMLDVQGGCLFPPFDNF